MTKPRPVVIKRVYNNNVVLATEPDGTEVVLLGKGVGYQRKPGETIDSSASERFVSELPYKATQVAELLTDASLEEAEVARAIVELGREDLNMKVGHSLLLPVLDHLCFAVRRAREGLQIDFPLRWEVAQIFPAETATGRRALALANERLGVRLQEEEWVAFALHFINHRWAGGDLSNTMAMTDTIGRSFKLLEQEWGTPIDQNSMSSARFVTHIRYLFVRAMEDRQLANSEIDVMNAVRDRYPEATQAALKLARQIEESVKHELTHEEVAYLALHTARLYTEVHFDN